MSKARHQGGAGLANRQAGENTPNDSQGAGAATRTEKRHAMTTLTVRNCATASALTPRQEGVAVSLAAGLSIESAAKKQGVSCNTVKAWLHDQPALKARIRWLRVEATERALSCLVDGMGDATWTIRRLLKSKSESMRLKAAEALLTHAAQLSALAELQERVVALEEKRQ